MKRYIFSIVLACTSVFSSAHNVIPVPLSDVINNAELVGIATIVKIEIRESRCEINTKIHLAPDKFLKGELDKKEIVQSYTHYYWKEAVWPWQEDCPSVHYTMPPVAEGIKEGMSVIFAARYFPEWKDHYATGTFNMDRLDLVMKFLGKKK